MYVHLKIIFTLTVVNSSSPEDSIISRSETELSSDSESAFNFCFLDLSIFLVSFPIGALRFSEKLKISTNIDYYKNYTYKK